MSTGQAPCASPPPPSPQPMPHRAEVLELSCCTLTLSVLTAYWPTATHLLMNLLYIAQIELINDALTRSYTRRRDVGPTAPRSH